MKLTELKTILRSQPNLVVTFSLPDGRSVSAHSHITEVGHVAKRFVDCGGTLRTSETCLLQLWAGSSKDDGHRLTAGKLAHILDLGKAVVPSDDVPVEVEYEDGAISQFPLEAVSAEGGEVRLQLARKHTDCLAKERCGAEDSGCCSDNDSRGIEDDNESCCAGASASEGRGCC